jgi:hypothetical protein
LPNPGGDDSFEFYIQLKTFIKQIQIDDKLPGVQKVGTAGTAGAGQTTFGWTK